MKTVDGFHQVIISMGLCFFIYWYQTYPLLEIIKATTGWDYCFEDKIKVGLRIQTLRQAFNLREDIEITKNELPGRGIGILPFESGPHAGKTVDIKRIIENIVKGGVGIPKMVFHLRKR